LLAALAGVLIVGLAAGLPLLLGGRSGQVPTDSTPITVPEIVPDTVPTTMVETEQATAVNYSAPGWTWRSFEVEESDRGVGRLASGDHLAIVSSGLDGLCDGGPSGMTECDWNNLEPGLTPHDPSSDVILNLVDAAGESMTVTVDGMGAVGGDGGLHEGRWVADAGEDNTRMDEEAGEWDLWITADGRTWDVRPVTDGLSAHLLNHGKFIFRGDLIVSYGPTNTTGTLISASAGSGQPFEPVFDMNDTSATSLASGESFTRGASVSVFILDEMIYAVIDDDPRAATGDGPGVWESTDGFNWIARGTATGLDSNLDNGGDSPRIISVVDGTAIAVWHGRSDRGLGILKAAVSTNGLTWKPVQPIDAAGNPFIQRVDTVFWPRHENEHDGWMAITAEPDDRLLVTRDGTTWYTLPANDAAPRAQYPGQYRRSGLLWIATPPDQ
jgi:hypothetical protein